ncbi:MAG TPA: protoheme IX farnesyltransferase, partial [Planctomycetaceae bacterium]|nr:protoheme IX farnesyltransferase [Planctomycetaceae bacterium]
HFLAIAWLCRDDYDEAGMKMLPRAAARRPGLTGLMGIIYALALLVISAWPRQLGLAGDAYLAAAIVLGSGYLVAAIRFWWNESIRTARGVLYASLIHLPLLLAALTWDHFRLLS